MKIEILKKVQKKLLLDNTTAKYKMSIKPPRKHPDSRSRHGYLKTDDARGLV